MESGEGSERECCWVGVETHHSAFVLSKKLNKRTTVCALHSISIFSTAFLSAFTVSDITLFYNLVVCWNLYFRSHAVELLHKKSTAGLRHQTQ